MKWIVFAAVAIASCSATVHAGPAMSLEYCREQAQKMREAAAENRARATGAQREHFLAAAQACERAAEQYEAAARGGSAASQAPETPSPSSIAEAIAEQIRQSAGTDGGTYTQLRARQETVEDPRVPEVVLDGSNVPREIEFGTGEIEVSPDSVWPGKRSKWTTPPPDEASPQQPLRSVDVLDQLLNDTGRHARGQTVGRDLLTGADRLLSDTNAALTDLLGPSPILPIPDSVVQGVVDDLLNGESDLVSSTRGNLKQHVRDRIAETASKRWSGMMQDLFSRAHLGKAYSDLSPEEQEQIDRQWQMAHDHMDDASLIAPPFSTKKLEHFEKHTAPALDSLLGTRND